MPQGDQRGVQGQGTTLAKEPGNVTYYGLTTGDPATDEAMTRTAAMAKATVRPAGVAGSDVGALNYTHAGTRSPGETRS